MLSVINQWTETTLADLSIEGKGNYGIPASAVEYSSDLFTYLRITDISDDGVLNKEGLKSVDDIKAERYLLKPNDIVFARTGNSTGKSYFYDGKDGKLVYAGFLIKFSLDSQKINPKYMRYYTISSEYRNWVESFSIGSTRGNINAKTYGNMKIKLPSREQQDFLVNILSTLDEKIEINNQINKKIEEMAQTIFKHWFVDFEFPNEDGKPYKSSGGEMIESELGMIPKGWRVRMLSEIGRIITGKTPPTKDEDNFGSSFNFITPRDVKEEVYIIKTERQLSIEGAKKIGNYVVRKNSIGVTCIGSNLGKVYLNTSNSYTNQQINTLELNDNLLYPYAFIMLKRYKDNFINMSSGSAVPIINKTAFSGIKAVVPKDNILSSFFQIGDSILKNIEMNQVQNITLKNLRDTLLPKLMSGEIRVAMKEGEDK